MSCQGLSCREICAFLCEYLEGELPADRLRVFEAHLRECPPCEQYLKTYKQTILLSKKCMCPGATKPPPCPEDLVKAIMRSIHPQAGGGGGGDCGCGGR